MILVDIIQIYIMSKLYFQGYTWAIPSILGSESGPFGLWI